jgi:hypothetical protein
MFVHSTLGNNRDVSREFSGRQFGRTKPDAPLPMIVALADTPIGVISASSRALAEDAEDADSKMMVGASHLVLPCFPNAGIAQQGVFSTNIRIPIDDANENHFRLRWTRRGFTEKELFEFKYGGYAFPLHEVGTYLSEQRKDNDYRHDPVLQRQFNYSGVVPFPSQDLMMIENQWGAIADRPREHLVASDRVIIFIRRRLLKMVKGLAEGVEPEEPFLLQGIRQEMPAPLVTEKRNQLPEETLDELATGFNTTRVVKSDKSSGGDAEEIWAPSVEVDETVVSAKRKTRA